MGRGVSHQVLQDYATLSHLLTYIHVCARVWPRRQGSGGAFQRIPALPLRFVWSFSFATRARIKRRALRGRERAIAQSDGSEKVTTHAREKEKKKHVTWHQLRFPDPEGEEAVGAPRVL